MAKIMINYEYEIDVVKKDRHILEQFISDIITKYCIDFMLDKWEGVKFIEKLPYDSSGRMENGYILLPINTVNNILYGDILKKQTAEATIFHEFCHFNLLNLLPELHQAKTDAEDKDNYPCVMAILIWIEYLSQAKSTFLEPYQNIEDYFTSVNEYSWDFSSYESFLLGIKHASYIISRDMDIRGQKKYFIENLKSNELRKMIMDIRKILLEMDSCLLEDNLEIIKPLEVYLISRYEQYPEL